MSKIIEVTVPDIGDFKNVDVIEILVKPGDKVQKDSSLIALESEKATMEIPSSHAGVVKAIKLKVGDKVSQGSLILTLEAEQESAPTPQTKAPEQPAAKAASTKSETEIQADVVVLGAGPGGYTAAFRAADLGKKVVLIERYPNLGGVCLNVGCIPSKALLHIAKVISEAEQVSRHGVSFGKPKIDIDQIRAWKESVVTKLTGGLGALAKQRNVQIIRGVGKFIAPHHIRVETADALNGTSGEVTVTFDNAIIAAGSQAVKIPAFPVDPRVMDSTGALQLADVPKKMLVIGGGIISLEMATVYHALGTKITIVEHGAQLIHGCDPDIVRPLQKRIEKRYEAILLNTSVVALEAKKAGILVTFGGEKAPAPQLFDRVLVAVGRRPNGKLIGAENAGVQTDDQGFIPVDKQQRTNVPHIFAIGDIVGQPMLAHKAVHEAHVAAEVIAGELQGNKELAAAAFNARVIPSVAYTDPEVAWVGLTEDQAKAQGIKVKKGLFPWNASGRAIANGRDEGVTKLLFDDSPEAHGHGKILGGGMVGTHAGDMIGEVALAIEMGADAIDIGKTIHPHPTLGESIGMAAEIAHGSCTDVPPARK